MGKKHIGKQSFLFENSPVITSWASAAGKRESEGPLASYFDFTTQDTYLGQKTWEQAELALQKKALDILARKSGVQNRNFPLVISGDLMNQCIPSSVALKKTGIPHLGIYGACSTMAESLLLASMVIDGGFLDQAVAMTSSHFASSERQYRFPLGYGAQRTPTAQWTVTGAGAALLCAQGAGPKITACTIGTVEEMGIKDANNMGAAMAPAAYATIAAHFRDLQLAENHYDYIVTGDLGALGKELLLSICRKNGLQIGGRLIDCGTLVFDLEKQDVHSGGSGCGCSAITLCGYLLEKLKSGKIKNILFCGTGALLSPVSVQQGMPISGICHAVAINGG